MKTQLQPERQTISLLAFTKTAGLHIATQEALYTYGKEQEVLGDLKLYSEWFDFMLSWQDSLTVEEEPTQEEFKQRFTEALKHQARCWKHEGKRE